MGIGAHLGVIKQQVFQMGIVIIIAMSLRWIIDSIVFVLGQNAKNPTPRKLKQEENRPAPQEHRLHRTTM